MEVAGAAGAASEAGGTWDTLPLRPCLFGRTTSSDMRLSDEALRWEPAGVGEPGVVGTVVGAVSVEGRPSEGSGEEPFGVSEGPFEPRRSEARILVSENERSGLGFGDEFGVVLMMIVVVG